MLFRFAPWNNHSYASPNVIIGIVLETAVGSPKMGTGGLFSVQILLHVVGGAVEAALEIVEEVGD